MTQQPSGRGGMPGRSGPPGNSNAAKHHLHTVRTDKKVLVTRALDGRTDEGRFVASKRGDLIADLGGEDNLSTQERALVDESVFLMLQLAHVNAWLAKQPALVNKRTKSLHPVVRERLALVTTLRTILGDLGLKRRTKDARTARGLPAREGKRQRPRSRASERRAHRGCRDTAAEPRRRTGGRRDMNTTPKRRRVRPQAEEPGTRRHGGHYFSADHMLRRCACFSAEVPDSDQLSGISRRRSQRARGQRGAANMTAAAPVVIRRNRGGWTDKCIAYLNQVRISCESPVLEDVLVQQLVDNFLTVGPTYIVEPCERVSFRERIGGPCPLAGRYFEHTRLRLEPRFPSSATLLKYLDDDHAVDASSLQHAHAFLGTRRSRWRNHLADDHRRDTLLR